MLDFPNSPTVGATYTGPGGVVWTFDGAKWASGASTTAFAPIASPAFTGDPTAPTPAYGDNDTSVATTAFVQAAVAPMANNVGRNLIHNPLFNVQQRGSGPFTASAAYTLDRWQITATLDTVSIAIGTMSDADRAAIGDEAATFSLYNTWTGNAGATAANYLVQKVENVRRLAGKTVTVSLWAKANAGTPKLGLNIANVFGTGGSPSAAAWATAVAVTTSTTWARYSATIAVPSVNGMTLGTNGDSSSWISIWYSSGANTNALAGGIGVQSGAVQIWGVQLEVGSVATPLEKPDPQQDLAKCQRFYQTGQTVITHYVGAAVAFGMTVPFPVVMRANPTIAYGSAIGADTNATMNAADVISNNSFRFYGSSTAAGAAQIGRQWAASADL